MKLKVELGVRKFVIIMDIISSNFIREGIVKYLTMRNPRGFMFYVWFVIEI